MTDLQRAVNALEDAGFYVHRAEENFSKKNDLERGVESTPAICLRIMPWKPGDLGEPKGLGIIYWNGDQVSGDWDEVYFDSHEAAEKAGWVIDEVVNGVYLGHQEEEKE
jgi:hypothetical protein